MESVDQRLNGLAAKDVSSKEGVAVKALCGSIEVDLKIRSSGWVKRPHHLRSQSVKLDFAQVWLRMYCKEDLSERVLGGVVRVWSKLRDDLFEWHILVLVCCHARVLDLKVP